MSMQALSSMHANEIALIKTYDRQPCISLVQHVNHVQQDSHEHSQQTHQHRINMQYRARTSLQLHTPKRTHTVYIMYKHAHSQPLRQSRRKMRMMREGYKGSRSSVGVAQQDNKRVHTGGIADEIYLLGSLQCIKIQQIQEKAF